MKYITLLKIRKFFTSIVKNIDAELLKREKAVGRNSADNWNKMRNTPAPSKKLK